VHTAATAEGDHPSPPGRIGFLDVVDTVERVVTEHQLSDAGTQDPDLDGVLAADAWARRRARELLSTPAGGPSASAGEGTA
jgi:1-deoxy-D-xylulose-5-phosphate reductoisomerase